MYLAPERILQTGMAFWASKTLLSMLIETRGGFDYSGADSDILTSVRRSQFPGEAG